MLFASECFRVPLKASQLLGVLSVVRYLGWMVAADMDEVHAGAATSILDGWCWFHLLPETGWSLAAAVCGGDGRGYGRGQRGRAIGIAGETELVVSGVVLLLYMFCMYTNTQVKLCKNGSADEHPVTKRFLLPWCLGNHRCVSTGHTRWFLRHVVSVPAPAALLLGDPASHTEGKIVQTPYTATLQLMIVINTCRKRGSRNITVIPVTNRSEIVLQTDLT